MALDLEVAISTTDRTPQYVHRTLESMLGDPRASRLRRRLVVSGRSGLYLDSWLGRADVEVYDRDAWQEVKDLPPEGKCLLNFERVLGGGDKTLLALEDDVVFTEDWTKKLEQALDVIAHARRGPKRRSPGFVLALYAARRFKVRPVSNYNPLHFYGNQALYIPGPVRVKLRHFIAGELAARRPKPADMFVRLAAEKGMFDILACNPSLCQHVGENSSLNLRKHQSPSFRP